MLNTILFSGLYNLSDVSVGYFTIYTLTVRLIALYAKVSTVEGQGNPDGSTSLGIGVNPVGSTRQEPENVTQRNLGRLRPCGLVE